MELITAWESTSPPSVVRWMPSGVRMFTSAPAALVRYGVKLPWARPEDRPGVEEGAPGPDAGHLGADDAS